MGDDKLGDLNEAIEAHYALECVLARLEVQELDRVFASLPERACEYLRRSLPGGPENSQEEGR
jgi:hypothetical protein